MSTATATAAEAAAAEEEEGGPGPSSRRNQEHQTAFLLLGCSGLLRCPALLPLKKAVGGRWVGGPRELADAVALRPESRCENSIKTYEKFSSEKIFSHIIVTFLAHNPMQIRSESILEERSAES